jgi:hypothetical protein
MNLYAVKSHDSTDIPPGWIARSEQDGRFISQP